MRLAFSETRRRLRRIFPRVSSLKKILIVDDEFLIRYSLAHMLQDASVEVTTAATWTAARKEVRSTVFDLCCLDIHLPDGTGVDIMKMVRQVSPGTRIVMMTGGEVTREMLSDILTQSGLLLSKPFDLFKVKVFVQCLLAGGDPSQCTFVDNDIPGLGLALQNNRRKHERRRNAEPVPCSLTTPGMIRTGIVLNVSNEGLCLSTRFPLHAGSAIAVVRDGESEQTGTVRWCCNEGNEEGYRTGIQFLHPGQCGQAAMRRA